MPKVRYALLVLLICVGCSKKGDDSALYLKVGVLNDGQTFFDWVGVLTYQTNSNGAVNRSGAHATGNFRGINSPSSVAVELDLKDENDERFTVRGHIMSPVPVDLELLGTSSEDGKPNVVLHFPAGASLVKFEGRLYTTYERSKKG